MHIFLNIYQHKIGLHSVIFLYLYNELYTSMIYFCMGMYLYMFYIWFIYTCMCAFVYMTIVRNFLNIYLLYSDYNFGLDTYFSEFGVFDLLSLNWTCDNNINMFSASVYIYWCIFNSAAPEFIYYTDMSQKYLHIRYYYILIAGWPSRERFL